MSAHHADLESTDQPPSAIEPELTPTMIHPDTKSTPNKPPAQPDFVYDPMHDKRHSLGRLTKPPKKRSWWKRLLLFLLAIGICVGAWFAFFTVKNIIKVAPNFFQFSQKLKGEDDGRVNILLLGIGDPGHDGEGLSDTNILMSVNTRDKKVALISIPRDTRVKIPGYGLAKINNANAFGDIPLAKETVSNFFGQPIQYYVRTDFTGLRQAVDSVGGIQIVNTDLLSDPEYPCDKNQWKSCGFTLKPGTYQADGTLALKYARCRKGTCGDDFGRASRQQEVIAGVRSKALSAGTILNPAKLTALIQTAGDNVKTDLSVGEMLRLNDLTKDIPSDQFINVVLSLQDNGFLKAAPDGTTDLVPVDSTLGTIKTFVENIFTYGPIWQERPRVMIQNGTVAPGLGGKLEQKFARDKYPITITQVTNALKRDFETTRLIDFTVPTQTPSTTPTKKTTAPTLVAKPNTRNYLENLLKVKASASDGTIPSQGADFVIIIGTDNGNYLPTNSTSVSPTR